MKSYDSKNFFKTQKWNGFWKLPADATWKYPGQLTVNAEELGTLTLHPGISRYKEIPSGENSSEIISTDGSWPCIHGKSQGKEITLFDVRMKQEKSNLFYSDDGPHEQVCSVRSLLIGVKHGSPEEPISREFSMRLENLSSWLNKGVMSIALTEKGDGSNTRQIIFKEPLEKSDSRSEIKLQVNKGTSWQSYQTPEGERIEATSDSLITITAPQDLSPSEIHGLVWSVQELFAAMIDGEPRVQSVSIPDPKRPLGEDVLFFTSTRHRGKSSKEAKSLTYIDDFQLEGLFSRWLAERKRNQSTYNIFFGMKCSDDQFLESKVVALVSALESLSKNEEIYFKGYRGRQKTPPSTVNLKDRLWGLSLELPLQIRALVVPNPSVFTEDAKEARHGISHTGETPIPPDDLYSVVCTIELFIAAYLLLKLGIKPNTLKKRFLEYGPTRRKIEFLRKHYVVNHSPKQKGSV